MDMAMGVDMNMRTGMVFVYEDWIVDWDCCHQVRKEGHKKKVNCLCLLK